VSNLENVQETVSGHMDAIVSCFKPGVKITVLVRSPGFPGRDFMMTNDDHDELIAMIERRKRADMS